MHPEKILHEFLFDLIAPAAAAGGEDPATAAPLEPAPQRVAQPTAPPPLSPPPLTEAGRSDASVALTREPAADMPSGPFQVLRIQIRDVELAVPLSALDTIVRWDRRTTRLPGQPSWQRGVTAHRGRPLRLVDLAGVIMPERASATVDEPDTQAYLMVVGGARCGLICDRIKRPQMVATEDVRWSGRYRYRPWARGVLKKELAVLLDVDALLRILGMQNAYD